MKMDLEISAVDHQLRKLNLKNKDSSYTDPELKNSSYQYPPYRKDQNKQVGSKIVFLKVGLIMKL